MPWKNPFSLCSHLLLQACQHVLLFIYSLTNTAQSYRKPELVPGKGLLCRWWDKLTGLIGILLRSLKSVTPGWSLLEKAITMNESMLPSTCLTKRFFVFKAGKTNEAHRDFVEKLKGVGHIEVTSLEDCDHLLVFCPVASRVGTDVDEALNKMPAGKPTILVVMHQTFNPDYVVAESRTLVNNPNIQVTVDCLFYEHHFLDSKRNGAAWDEVCRSFSS